MHAQEMFHHLRRGLDNELDTIVTVLAKRSGEVTCPDLHQDDMSACCWCYLSVMLACWV